MKTISFFINNAELWLVVVQLVVIGINSDVILVSALVDDVCKYLNDNGEINMEENLFMI